MPNGLIEIIPETPADPNGIDRLNAALARAQANFAPITRSSVGQAGTRKYKYADLGAVIRATMPPLAAEQLSLRQPIRHRDGRMWVVTELHHSSGQYITDDGLPLSMNLKPQDLGSELTYMRRYGVCSMLGVASEEDDDDGRTAHEAAGQNERDLAAARQRNAPATAAAKREGDQVSGRKDGPRVAVITELQAKEWNAARKKAGHTVAAATEYVHATFGGTLAQVPADRYAEALAWATTPAKGKGSPADGTPAKTEGIEDLKADEPSPTRITKAMRDAFFDAARKAGKSSGEMDRYLESLKITNAADMTVAQVGSAMTWAAGSTDTRPPETAEEKTAREGFGILGLSLTEQSEVIDRWDGDWSAIAEAVSAAIDRRNDETGEKGAGS
jgi:hypothetical protein